MSLNIRTWAEQALRALEQDLAHEAQLVSNTTSDTRQSPSLGQLAQMAKDISHSVHVRQELDGIIPAAHDAMARADRAHQSTTYWRRCYTDACILASLAEVLETADTPLSETQGTSCIARLDRAIIIAGPCGEGRLELILEFIAQIQSRTQWSTKRDITVLPLAAAGSRSLSQQPDLKIQRTFANTIPRFDRAARPPSLTVFLSGMYKGPFIISGYVRDWPAMQEHPWASTAYLRRVAGPGRIVPVEVGSDYRTDDWTQELMSWDDFLDSLDAERQTGHRKPVLYLAQHNLFTQFPALRDDIVVPDYVYASPPAPPNYPDYRPPGNDEQLVVNAWLGPPGAVSPAHTDPFYNLYGQVVGRKTVWLAPPEATPCMYPLTANSESDHASSSNPAANNVAPSMSNTSRVDVFSPPEDNDQGKAFPLFYEKAVPQAMCTTLEPGDILFFPPGWWHAMRSEETSFSVSMWF